MGGRIVQLVQGERLALESTAIDEWIDSLRAPPSPQADLHRDVAVATVLEAAMQSAERGQFVPIS